MNDGDKKAFYNWYTEKVALNHDSKSDAAKSAWQAACAYKDAQLINGSKMKQMNDRIEELKELAKLQADTITRLERENKKLREALKE